MKKRVLLAGVLTAAMMAMTACNGMPGMGNAQPAATQAQGGDSSEAAAGDDKVYELKISTSQTEQALITRNYQKLADVLNEYDGPRHFMTNKPINTPDDLKGMRIRTIGQEVCTETIQAMGATPISMSWGEVYNGIQSKALEGCEAQNTSTYPSRLYEVCKYQSKTGHFQLMQGLICGQSWFESLPEDLQTLLVETSIEVGQETAADVMTEADEAEKAMVEAGMTIVEPDLAPFKAAVDPVYEKLGYAELRDKLYKEIGKTN